MKKTILPLLMVSMYFTGNATEKATEKTNKDWDSTTPTTRESPIDQTALFRTALYPDDRASQIHLESALYGDFDPEAPQNFDEDLQITLLASRLSHLLNNDEDYAFDLSDGHTSSTSSPASKLPPIESQKLAPLDPPRDGSKIGENAYAPKIPAFIKGSISEEMIFACARIWHKLAQETKKSVSVDNLTAVLLKHSLENKSGWSELHCRRIAEHLIDGENLESPRANEMDGSDKDKK